MGRVLNKIHHLIKFLLSPWLLGLLVGLLICTVLIVDFIQPTWLMELHSIVRFTLLVGIVISVLILIFIAIRYHSMLREKQDIESQLVDLENAVSLGYERLEALFLVNQNFVDAGDENEVVEPVLKIIIELVKADGATFVPLDEHGQPQTALVQGEFPANEVDVWVDYLASDNVRMRCGQCESYNLLSKPDDCVLLTGPFKEAGDLLCHTVTRGEHIFGVLSVFFLTQRNIDERTQTFIRALIEEMALGLDSVRMRRKELNALRQMQRIRQKSDLKNRIEGLLENVHRNLEGDISILLVPKSDFLRFELDMSLGDLGSSARSFINGIMHGIMASSETILMNEITSDSTKSSRLGSLMAVPLETSERSAIGAILIGNENPRAFNQRQLALLQTIAGQIALVIQNASLMADIEYNTLIQERARLAREIHDGLAQTIGYLKLRVAQIRNNLNNNETQKLSKNLDLIYASLSEAYLDVRQSIDDLRIAPDGDDLEGWIGQTLSEFEELSKIAVTSQIDVRAVLAPEVQAQLIRILQEVLSNVRKHARANHVWLDCHSLDGVLILEVRDNGVGFLPEDVTTSVRHGLRGMRERSDLLGADFQIISKPDRGTAVRLSLPIKDVEELIL